MDITPLSDSLSGDKALYDKAFKLVPGYRQQKICNLKTMLQNAALLPPDFCSITQHAHLYPALLQALWQTIHRLPKNFHFRSLFQMLPAPICRNTTMKPACGANGKPYFKGHADLYFNLSHSGNFAVCIVAGMPCGIDIEGTCRLSRPLQKDFFQKRNITGFMIQKMYLYRRNVFSVSGL